MYGGNCEGDVVRPESLIREGHAGEPIPFDAAAARAFGRVASSLRAAGGKRTARACDALIAATALVNELPVYTSNPADFEGIDGLEVHTTKLTEG